jgi:serine/threonine protein kinase
LEYCDGGDLEKYIAESKFISETECLDFLKQIVQAFLLLTENNIVHRDIKPANILLKNG